MNTTMKRALACAAMTVGSSAALWAGPSAQAIVASETYVTNVVGETTLAGTWVVAGVIQKTGAGTLKVPVENVCFVGDGRIDVLEGRLEVTRTTGVPAEIPAPDAMQSAAFWFRADRNLVIEGGNLVEWRDSRETSAAPGDPRQYIFARSMTNLAKDGAYPSAGSDGGKAYVDFGGIGSGQWMAWRKPDDTGDVWLSAYHTFAAYDPREKHGHLYGANTNVTTTIDGKACNNTMYFAAFPSGLGGTTWFADSGATPGTYQPVRSGRVFLNGEQISPSSNYVKNRAVVIETEAGGYDVPAAGNFCNFRSYQQSAGAYTYGDRVGGGRYHEVLVFTNALGEADRLLIGARLARTWVTESLRLPSRVNVSSAASLKVDRALNLADLRIFLDGELVGTEGMDLAGGLGVGQPVRGTLALEDGVTVTNRALMRTKTVVGKNYTVDAASCLRVTAGTPGAVVKSGAGALAVGDFGGVDAAVSVNGGSVHVRAPEPAVLPTCGGNLIQDGGFELPGKSGTGGVAAGVPFGAWTSEAVASASVRILSAGQWQYVTGTPEGEYRLILKNRGGVRQTIDVPADGRYEITFRSTARNGYSSLLTLSIDGERLVWAPALCTDDRDWAFNRIVTPFLTRGEHTLRLMNEFTNDRCVAVDDIRMHYLDAVVSAPVPNANFEVLSLASAGEDFPLTDADISSRFAFDSSALTGWTASDPALVKVLRRPSDVEYRLRKNSGSWNSSVLYAPDGALQTLLVSNAQISTSFAVPRDGAYRFSALLSLTSDALSYQGVAESANSVSVQVTVNGETETLTVKNWALQWMAGTKTFACRAGDAVTLSVGTVSVAGKTSRVIVDDVAFEMTEGENLLRNPSFAEGAAVGFTTNGWDCYIEPTAGGSKRSPVLVNDAGNDVNFGATVIDGTERLRILSDTGYAYQHVSLEPGDYLFSFWARSRAYGGRFLYGLNELDVEVVRGTTTNLIGRAVMSDVSAEFVRFEYTFRVETAGSYAVGIHGRTPGDSSTLADAFSLVRLTTPAATWRPLTENTTVRGAEGAQLFLNYGGQYGLDRFRWAGRAKSGLIGSTTVPGLFGVGTLLANEHGFFVIAH